jgi:uncharacterized protein with HEPN domain/predicted nucleotidyltransferase
VDALTQPMSVRESQRLMARNHKRWFHRHGRKPGLRGDTIAYGTEKGETMGIAALLDEKKKEIREIAAKHGARNVRVFGSVARGEARPDSDVDFLVEMEPGRTLLDLGGLLMDLRALLGWEVDVVTERGLKPRIRDRVLKEADFVVRDPKERLSDVLDAIANIERYSVRGRQAFEYDELIQNWFVRHLQIIGEAAYALPKELRDQQPDIPSTEILGMRHILVHDYFVIDTDIVWDAVERDLPDLKAKIERMLRKLEGKP